MFSPEKTRVIHIKKIFLQSILISNIMKLKKKKTSIEQLKKDADKNSVSESGIDRREFLSRIATAAIPTIAFLTLGNLSGLIANPKNNNQNPKSEIPEEANSCLLSCEGGCRASCEGECRGTCQGLCYLTCEGSCKYTCEGGCNTTCDGCKGSCSGGCSGGAW